MYNKKGSGLRVDPQGMPTIKGSRRVRSTKDTKKEWSHQWEENGEPVLLLGQRNRVSRRIPKVKDSSETETAAGV